MEWLIMSITSLISFACGTLLFFPFVNGWNNYYMFGVATVICAVRTLLKFIFLGHEKSLVYLHLFDLIHGLVASIILLVVFLSPKNDQSNIAALYIIISVELINRLLLTIYWYFKHSQTMLRVETVCLALIIHMFTNVLLISLKNDSNSVFIIIIGILINVTVLAFVVERPTIDLYRLYRDKKKEKSVE